jgi:hypothetical protein
VSVAPQTQYSFSGWVASWTNLSPARLRVFINGVQVGQDFAAPSTNGLWSQFVKSWNSGSNTSAILAIVDENVSGDGSDFSLDDLSLSTAIPFSHFGGSLRIDPDTGVFFLNGGFTLGPGSSIDPTTEEVTFSVGSYSVTLPAGSFFKVKTGYVFQKKVNHIFLCLYIKNTSTPGKYALLANSGSGALTGTTSSPLPVALTIGDDAGTTGMPAKFY